MSNPRDIDCPEPTCGAHAGDDCFDLRSTGNAQTRLRARRVHAMRRRAYYGEADPAPPFTASERSDVLAVAAVPPRALRAIADHLTRCAAQHGVEPHQTRPDRDAQAHMAGADRHLLRMARVGAPGYDLDAIDEDSGAPQLVAVASRVMLALECWLGERERKAGASS